MFEILVAVMVPLLVAALSYLASARGSSAKYVTEGMRILIEDQRQEIEYLRMRVHELEERVARLTAILIENDIDPTS